MDRFKRSAKMLGCSNEKSIRDLKNRLEWYVLAEMLHDRSSKGFMGCSFSDSGRQQKIAALEWRYYRIAFARSRLTILEFSPDGFLGLISMAGCNASSRS